MLGLLYRLFIGHFGCEHVWDTTKKTQYTDVTFGHKAPAVQYIQVCKKCGKVQHKHIIGWK